MVKMTHPTRTPSVPGPVRRQPTAPSRSALHRRSGHWPLGRLILSPVHALLPHFFIVFSLERLRRIPSSGSDKHSRIGPFRLAAGACPVSPSVPITNMVVYCPSRRPPARTKRGAKVGCLLLGPALYFRGIELVMSRCVATHYIARCSLCPLSLLFHDFTAHRRFSIHLSELELYAELW